MRIEEDAYYTCWGTFEWSTNFVSSPLDGIGDGIVENIKYYNINRRWGLSNFSTYSGNTRIGVLHFFFTIENRVHNSVRMEKLNEVVWRCNEFVSLTKLAYSPDRPAYLPALPKVYGVSDLCGVWPFGDYSTFQFLTAGPPPVFKEVDDGVYKTRSKFDRSKLSKKIFGEFAIGYIVGYRITDTAITVGYGKLDDMPEDLFEYSIEYSRDVAVLQSGDTTIRKFADRLEIQKSDCVVTVMIGPWVSPTGSVLEDVTGDVFYRAIE